MSRIFSAIYEEGVLKPLEPLGIKENTKVRITLEVVNDRKGKIEEILDLARKSCEGLTEEELSILENSRLDNTLFFPDRIDTR